MLKLTFDDGTTAVTALSEEEVRCNLQKLEDMENLIKGSKTKVANGIRKKIDKVFSEEDFTGCIKLNKEEESLIGKLSD